MVKKLEKKIIEGIVKSQINLIKEDNDNDLLNYSLLKRYLTEGIEKYFKDKNSLPREIDFGTFKQIEKNMKTEVLTRLINVSRDYFKIEYPNNPNEDQLLELYNAAESDLLKNGNYFGIRNYGNGTHKLLESYLKFKSLIKDK